MISFDTREVLARLQREFARLHGSGWIDHERRVLPAHLSGSVEAAYFLSFETDERRPVRFLLAVCDSEHALFGEMSLARPVPLDGAVARTLARACHPERACFKVIAQGSGRRPFVSSVAPIPVATTDPSLATVVLIEAEGPGRLRIETGGAEVRIERRRVSATPAQRLLRRIELHEFVKSAVEQSESRVLAAWPHHAEGPTLGSTGDSTSARRDSCHRELTRLARECGNLNIGWMLRSVQRKRSGGAVLVIPGRLAMHRSKILNAQWLERAGGGDDSERWTSGLRDSLVFRTIMEIGLKGTSPVIEARGHVRLAEEEAEAHSLRAQLLDAGRRWAGDVERTADLAGVDGALILDSRLEPRAFAAKFAIPSMRDLPKHCRAKLRGKGTRHLSMASTINQIPGALGFVASEDGPVSLFRYKDDVGVSGPVRFLS